jgi:hypothetical protein
MARGYSAAALVAIALWTGDLSRCAGHAVVNSPDSADYRSASRGTVGVSSNPASTGSSLGNQAVVCSSRVDVLQLPIIGVGVHDVDPIRQAQRLKYLVDGLCAPAPAARTAPPASAGRTPWPSRPRCRPGRARRATGGRSSCPARRAGARPAASPCPGRRNVHVGGRRVLDTQHVRRELRHLRAGAASCWARALRSFDRHGQRDRRPSAREGCASERPSTTRRRLVTVAATEMTTARTRLACVKRILTSGRECTIGAQCLYKRSRSRSATRSA